MNIGGIDLDKKVLIIAEAGNNHEGDFGVAREMVRAAARAGADAVKFQTIVPERLIGAGQEERLAQLGRYALSREQFQDLARLAGEEGILFLSTPFDPDSARFLEPLVPAFKIASGDNDYLELLSVAAASGKPLLLSTGMSDIDAVRAAMRHIEDAWREKDLRGDLALLHCVSSYPTAPEDANLLAITELAKLGFTVGYSDHTLGIDAAAPAVALGARVLEKHFTLDHGQSDFHDHKLSADPAEFAEMVRRVRLAEKLLGKAEKTILACEKPVQAAARRSIASAHFLEKGHVLALDDLDWLRPGGGLKPGQEGQLVGKRLKRNIVSGGMILPGDVE